jgi:calcium-dependent protein kinase
MAPEIFIKNSYNEKVDIWSAGVILYNMATGLEPITVNEKKSKKKQILNRDINFEEIKNEHIRQLCKEMMEKYPNKRINAKIALEKAKSIRKILFNRHYL